MINMEQRRRGRSFQTLLVMILLATAYLDIVKLT